MKPLDKLSERSRKENESTQHRATASKMIVSMQLEALKDNIKKAIKECDYERLEHLKDHVAQFEQENEDANLLERRYKTNDATVEKVARLLNENPNGLLLLRDELNGWLQTLNKAGREGDREFYLESWNGYGSYTVDRVGSGTLHVPALCLSIFGGIQPGKLQAYVEKTIQCSADDDGLLQRFQLLIYPELSPTWSNVDRNPNLAARERVFEIFNYIDSAPTHESGQITAVRFSEAAQEAFNVWRQELESRLRSNEIGCSAFESHLAKYRSLMPSLALLFWLLEDPKHIHGSSAVSFSAATLAIRWCDFLEKHAFKAYRIGQSAEAQATKKLAEYVENGLVPHASSVRNIYRRQLSHLKTPQLVEQALESLEELNWLRVVQATVQGGKSKRIMIHPKFRQAGGAL
jgi:putative DNA primase/helicase